MHAAAVAAALGGCSSAGRPQRDSRRPLMRTADGRRSQTAVECLECGVACVAVLRCALSMSWLICLRRDRSAMDGWRCSARRTMRGETRKEKKENTNERTATVPTQRDTQVSPGRWEGGTGSKQHSPAATQPEEGADRQAAVEQTNGRIRSEWSDDAIAAARCSLFESHSRAKAVAGSRTSSSCPHIVWRCDVGCRRTDAIRCLRTAVEQPRRPPPSPRPVAALGAVALVSIPCPHPSSRRAMTIRIEDCNSDSPIS